jgi:hypothetical protein
MAIEDTTPAQDIEDLRAELLLELKDATRSCARAMIAATDAGIGPAVLMPLMVDVLGEEGIEIPAVARGFLGA